jgi:hypothetical protein
MARMCSRHTYKLGASMSTIHLISIAAPASDPKTMQMLIAILPRMARGVKLSPCDKYGASLGRGGIRDESLGNALFSDWKRLLQDKELAISTDPGVSQIPLRDALDVVGSVVPHAPEEPEFKRTPRILRTAAGISAACVLPKPRINPLRAAPPMYAAESGHIHRF